MRKNSVELAGVVTLALGLTVVGAPSHAGDNNTIHIKQESLGFGGNSLMIDQSEANNSLVVGPSGALRDALVGGTLVTNNEASVLRDYPAHALNPPALQRGEGNVAVVTMTGDGGTIQLLQDNSPDQPVSNASGGNNATISAHGSALGAVIQQGNLNNANLRLSGNFATGLISQNGSELNADLTVPAGGSGQIIQNGSGSTASVVVESNLTSVTYVQNGNNLQSMGTTGVQVFSTNPGTISITQTGF